MDTRILFALKQGPRSLENHIREFLACAHYSDLPDIILIEIFCDGINQPLRSQLRREGPRSSLSCFLDFALLTVGSLFTVGVADEDRDTASMTEMVDALECAHKMAAITESAPEPESAPEAAPSQELAESAPTQELAKSAPEAADPGARSQSPLQRPLRPRSSQSSSLSPAGFVRLPRAPAGPVRLTFVSIGSFQFSACRAPPRLSTSRIPPDVRASRVPP